jgi:membrane-bound lytic murein transglycosylase D
MVGTAVENGLRRDWYIDERSDPEKATVAAAKYFNTLAKLFDGDWHLALASYNMGPGGIQRALKLGHAADFWQLAAKPRLLPRETREYVPMILAAIVIAKNPGQYGFDIEPESAPAYEKVVVSHPVDLRRVAEWSDTTIDVIQALNPELRRWTTPVRDTAYELKVPMGKADVVTARLSDAPEVDLTALKWYTVKKGETLAGIAKKLQVSRTDLAEANYVRTTVKLEAGDKLMIPHEATALLAARTERSVPLAEARATVAPSGQLAEAANSNRVKVIYKVKQGDTLASIARAFRTDIAALRSWNKLTGSHIAPGDRLTIFAARAD